MTSSNLCFRFSERLLLCLISLMAFQSARCQTAAEVVRNDWYLRESLCAIRDWEAILARWEKEKTPEAAGSPVFPVPATGQTVAWPVPIPWRLRPTDDRTLEFRVRLVEGGVEVAQSGSGGKAGKKRFPVGGPVLGYRHPGAGGKDGMYIDYPRKFDRLAVAEARPARFALQLDGPPDLGRGPEELAVSLRNLDAKPLALNLQLDLHEPEQTRSCGRRTLALAVGAAEVVRFRMDLRRPGGGLLVLRINDGSESFWVPLFTHVENLAALFEGIDQILADTPDAAARKRLAGLKGRAAQWDTAPTHMPGPAAWRALFEEASALRDRLLLSRIDFDRLLFTRRKPYVSIQPFMDAHHMYNPPGGGIYVLSPVRPDGKVTPVLDSLGEGIYRDVCLHWTAKRLLFSFGNGSDLCWDKISPDWDGKQSYHIYEVNADGSGLRQLTTGPKHDCEPFYLPDGQIGFTSDRPEHYVMCGGDVHAPLLHVMNPDGSGLRQLSFNVFNDFNPCVMPDGRFLYGRWEYNERSVTSVHNAFTINPDGSMMATLYGNASIVPNVIMFPRPVPGSHKIMALFTSHHGQMHGAIGVMDARRGPDGTEPVTVLTPDVPITGEHPGDSRYGWFSDPTPLDETTYLCSFTPTVRPWLANSWGLYIGDRHGNLALVYRDPEISCAESVPLHPRPQPHIRPAAVMEPADAAGAEATLLVADVHLGLPDVPRGTAKYLRIIEDVPRKGVPRGGVITTSGTPIYTVKRIFGTVPVESDGSAHFAVPANTNVYFEVLDREELEIQRMRSVVCLKPGERRMCIGCHEPKYLAPPNTRVSAARRPASRPVPPPWGTRILSYLRDIQPVLDDQCVRCHSHGRQTNKVVLTADLTDQFCIAYEELLPYLSVANSHDKPWDQPENVYPRPPYTYGSKASRLMQLLAAGHYDVKLNEEQRQRLINWIDANGVYYDRYETEESYPNRRIFKAVGQDLTAIYGRRCASCHQRADGKKGEKYRSWWLSLNRHEVKSSRALAAPLARAAGGWQSCGEPVFANPEDPDYQALLAALTELRDQLARQPRADLLSLN